MSRARRRCSECGSENHIRGSKCPALKRPKTQKQLTTNFMNSGCWLTTINNTSSLPLFVVHQIAAIIGEIAQQPPAQQQLLCFSVFAPTGADPTRKRLADFRRNPLIPKILRLSNIPRLLSPNFDLFSREQLKIGIRLIQSAFTRERQNQQIKLPLGVPSGRGSVDFFLACKSDDPIEWSIADCIRMIQCTCFFSLSSCLHILIFFTQASSRASISPEAADLDIQRMFLFLIIFLF